MAIVINGSGTISGISVGGLPDSIVDAGTLATDSVTAAKIATNSVDSAELIDGAVDDSHMASISGRKNMVINGAMQVAQRGTSATGIDTDSSATEAYRTLDRFIFGGNDAGVWTMTQDSDSPVGFGSSMKLDCTTAKSSLDAGSYLYVLNRIEAQDLQQLGYGTSSPQAITLSFWVKSPKTGTHYAELYHGDSSGSTKRKNSYAYTVSSANTWEKKSMTFAGDTGVNAIVNDTGYGLMLMWYLAAGSNLTSGTNTNDNWQNTEANRTPNQVNCADSTSNNFYLTGVQLELGSTATDFEHRSFGEELALCQRYFHQQGRQGSDRYEHFLNVAAFNTTQARGVIPLPTTMRAFPTVSADGDFQTITGLDIQTISLADGGGNPSVGLNFAVASGMTTSYAYTIRSDNDADSYIQFDAEL